MLYKNVENTTFNMVLDGHPKYTERINFNQETVENK